MAAEILMRIEALTRALFGDDADLGLTSSHRLLKGDTLAQRIDQGGGSDVLQVLESERRGRLGATMRP